MLKPFPSTCDIKKPTSWGWEGMRCRFVNVAGQTIKIKDINAKMNGDFCLFPQIDISPVMDVSKSHIVWRFINVPHTQPAGPACYNYETSTFCDLLSGDNTWLDLPADSQFFVYVMGWHDIGDPCGLIKQGETYDVYVDITYDINIGGIVTTKHSSGHIFGTY